MLNSREGRVLPRCRKGGDHPPPPGPAKYDAGWDTPLAQPDEGARFGEFSAAHGNLVFQSGEPVLKALVGRARRERGSPLHQATVLKLAKMRTEWDLVQYGAESHKNSTSALEHPKGP